MKKVFALMLSAMFVFSLAGCGGGNNAETDSNSAPGTSEKKGKTVITLIQNKVEIQEKLEEAVKEFNSTHEGIEVQTLGIAGDNLTTMLQTQFGSSPEKAPTIFTTAAGAEFEKFFPYMAEVGDTKAAANIVEGQDTQAIKDGKLYGLPVALEGYGLIYNKDLFAKAGIKAEDIKSIDDLVTASEKLEQLDGVKNAIAFAEESYFRFMHLFNWPFALMDDPTAEIAKINSGEVSLKDIPELQQFAKDLDKIKPYTNLSKATYDEQVAGFAEGQYAMIHQGNWAQTILNDYEVDFEYAFMPVPFNGTDSLPIGNNNFFRINKYATEDQQAAAKEFMDWLMTEPEGQRFVTEEFKLIPVYTGFDTSNMDPLSQDMSNFANEGKALPWVFEQFPAGAHIEFSALMEKYYADQITSEGLLEEIEKTWMNSAKAAQ